MLAGVTALLYGTAVESTAQIYIHLKNRRERKRRSLARIGGVSGSECVLTFDKKTRDKRVTRDVS